MGELTEKLERLKLWVQILATIAVPIILVVIGNQVQQSIAEKEVSKSYVQMAIEILKAQPSEETKDLRLWAVATVDKLSPIPLSGKAREQLERSSTGGAAIGGGIVKYVECAPTKDEEVARWLLTNFPKIFQECPKGNEVGVFKYRTKQYWEQLQSGESLVTLNPADGESQNELDSYISSFECKKVKNAETAKWLIRQYRNVFHECSKINEVGYTILKRAKDK